MIHGNALSIGCVAIGDVAIEKLFWLVAQVGIERTRVVISPSLNPLQHLDTNTPDWVKQRYEQLDKALRAMDV